MTIPEPVEGPRTDDPPDEVALLGPRATKITEFVVSLAFTIGGAVLLPAAAGLGLWSEIGPAPGLFPFLSGMIMLIAGGIAAIRSGLALRHRAEDSAATAGVVVHWSRPAIAIGLYVGYVALLGVLGFVVATALLLFGLLILVGRRPLWSSILIAIGAVIVLRIGLGELLAVPLPLSRIVFLNALGL